MKFAIKHEIKGRIRIHLAQKHMTYRQADILQCYLEKEANISKASVYVRTQDVAVVYTGSRDGLIRLLSRFSYETAQVSESALENSGRELNETWFQSEPAVSTGRRFPAWICPVRCNGLCMGRRKSI